VSDDENPAPLSRLDVLKGLRLSTWEGVWATVWMVLTTGPFQVGYARLLGASDFALGLIAALPAAVGLLQLPASLRVERGISKRRFVGFFAIAGRLLWLPIALLPFLAPPPLRLPLFLLLLLISSALLTVTVPAWTSWMSELVPAETRGRYFARRNTLAGIVAMLVPLPAGWALDLAVKQKLYDQKLGFAALFVVGCLAAVVAFSFLMRQPESSAAAKTPSESPLKSLTAPLADRNFRRFLSFAGAVIAGQSLAGQFFVAWQLDEKALGLPYLAVQLLGAITSGASLSSMPLWGWLADKYGGRPVLVIGAWGTLSAPLFWLFTSPEHPLWLNLILIIVLNMIAGASWAAVGLTQFNLMLSLTPPEKRATYVAVSSAVGGVIGFIAPILGGILMTALAPVHLALGPLTIKNYQCMFLLTDMVRLGAIALLTGVRDEGSDRTRDVLGRLVGTGSPKMLAPLRRLTAPISEDSRRDAAERLGQVGSPLAVEELIAALDDVSPEVRLAAARALGDIGDARAVPALAAKLGDLAAGIEEQAAHSLGFIGDWSATKPLTEALSGPDAGVRIAALRALARLGDPASAPALIAQLSTAHPTRCEYACAALAALGERVPPAVVPTALERLLYLLAPEVDRGMRLAAARALEVLTALLPESAFEPLAARLEGETEPAVLARLATVLVHLNKEMALSPVLAALDRAASSRLAYRQTLVALSDTLLEPGTLYRYLTLEPMARDEAVSRLLGHIEGGAALLEAFARGDARATLAALTRLAPEDDALYRLALRPNPTTDDALLGILRVATVPEK
jgi:HEAT repeat protein/Na+/melibiose symporter-like transporter